MKTRFGLAALLIMGVCNAQDGVGVKYSSDKLGQSFVDDLNGQMILLQKQKAVALMQVNNIDTQINSLNKIINERQTAIDYIKNQRAFLYFTVNKGSFKAQLAKFADRLQIKTIRWAGVPSCIDWDLDATYDIKMTDTKDAIDEFLDGMPLSYEYFSRDNSLNLTSTVIIEGCPNE